jgi:polyphosphate kinase
MSAPSSPADPPRIEPTASEAFINRELSWLEFNLRVLEEAENADNPLMERLKFLAIFSSNLDEFFMVRVSGLREQAFGESAPQDEAPDGLTAVEQLRRIAARTQELVARQYRCLRDSIAPAMAAEGFVLLRYADLDADQLASIDRFFYERALPILTPMAIDPAHPSPRYHNRGLYIGVQMERQQGLGPKRLFAVVQVPQVLPRFVNVGSPVPGQQHFVLLEDLVAARLTELFGGFRVLSWTTFRITRDSDLELLEQESDDMLKLIEERLKARQRGQAVRIEVSARAADDSVARAIIDEEELQRGSDDGSSEVYRIDGPLDLTCLWELHRIPGYPHLHDRPFTPRMPRGLERRGDDLFAEIAARDILLHHPFESFDPVVEFVTRAAADPRVLAIKQTLYRTSGDSPISRALIAAAEAGKHVTALVELKARFDEANNVSWARLMERAGVHVVFGFLDLKTHCKLSLVVRSEGQGLRRYVHLGTGNYNPTTALLYTDLGLFTADEQIAEDASAVFNLLTGYSQGHAWRKLVVAPSDLHRRTIELIEEQAARARAGRPSRIVAKLNALVDRDVITALYRASQAGVPIDIIARGICALRPGVPGLSETIRVRSVVDRFLEHSRLYVFGPDDDARVFIASADWMPRNFFRRVELMVPIENPELVTRILREIIPVYLADNTRARVMDAGGSFRLCQPAPGETPIRCQTLFLEAPGGAAPLEPVVGSATPRAGRSGRRAETGGPRRERRSARQR